ncbi:uncharacterized protein LOC133779911 [Humulus lupulus]|uniref:uncharacterized protein LOC133779911 n=1 Tax=Humulus lupulus TaxID=3486 RepID=UPI002B402DFB|nr:uncharacterized protein LOC133779911 [Humulus lupulus]
MDKLAITYSSNVSPEVREDIRTSLGLTTMQTHDKYLGLPYLVGKNKRRALAYIKDRVWHKLKGWKGKLFLAGGKEVLIKAVIQATLTYVISIFKLPISFCRELDPLEEMGEAM